jgi:hypothetical protein
MDVCVVLLYNKDKRQSQDNHNKAVQIKYRPPPTKKKKKNRRGHGWLSVVIVVYLVR